MAEGHVDPASTGNYPAMLKAESHADCNFLPQPSPMRACSRGLGCGSGVEGLAEAILFAELQDDLDENVQQDLNT